MLRQLDDIMASLPKQRLSNVENRAKELAILKNLLDTSEKKPNYLALNK
jgi:hypothetical protein